MTPNTSQLSGDPIDLQGLAIIGDRQHLAGKIGHYKVQHGIPIYDAKREAQLLQSFCDGAEKRGIVGKSAGEVIERLFIASRAVQQRIFDTLTAQDVAQAQDGDAEFARLRRSMQEMNDALLEYMAARARIISKQGKNAVFTKEQWITIAKISPYDLDPVLAEDLYNLLSNITLKVL